MAVSIIIPAYNEEFRLPATLAATADYFEGRGETYEILIIDDGSRDGTAKVVEAYCKNHPERNIRCLNYGGNRGKGYAVRFGMLRATGDLRLFCDADMATPIEEYAVVLTAMKNRGADIGIGSRPLRDSQLIVHQPWYRERFGRCSNYVIQFLAVRGIRDTQCGFKIFTADAAEDVFSHAKIDAFAFDVEALLLARRLGYSIAEVPIRWSDTDGSRSSIKW
ncbi:MAG: dolichyl-phosphate beta-glucosyltransferase [Capsulimonadaceae bacterium]